MGNFINLIKQILGKGIGIVITLFKVMVVIALVQGIVTGNWRNAIICGVLIVFIVLVSRYATNMIAFFSTFIPFAGELFQVDPELREKGEQFRENGYDIFKK